MRPPDDLYAIVRVAAPDTMDADELDVLTGQIARLRSWCDSVQVRATRRQRALADEGRATDPRNSLTRHGGRSSRDARAASERETVCTAMPSFEEALAVGAVTAGHVDAVAAAIRDLDRCAAAELFARHDDLLDDAGRMGVDGFERSVRDLARHIVASRTDSSDADELDRQRAASKVTRWVDRETGMCHTHLVMDPVSDRTFWTAVQQERARLRRSPQHRSTSFDRLTVDAVIAATRARGGARLPSISVLIDLETLVGGLRPGSICETDTGTPLPVSTVRRMACDARLVPIVLGGDGVVLEEGRAKRLATAEQRLAIAAMHRTCIHPDCTVTVDECRIHHVREWTRDLGETDLDELAPVCETHHHDVHEGGWGLSLAAGRIATWTRPDGTVYWTGSTADRRADALAC